MLVFLLNSANYITPPSAWSRSDN